MALPRKTVLASCSGLTVLGLTLAATGCSSGESFCDTSQELLQLGASYTDATVLVGQSLRDLPSVTQNGPVTAATLVGGKLPPGTTLQQDGNVTGTPTEAGTYLLQVQLANAQGAKLTVPAKITVLPAGNLELAYATPRTFKLGTAIATQAPALSQVMPGWTIAYALSKGSLPAGLSLDPKTGEITGTPTTPGVFTFEATVTNGSRTAVCPPVTYIVEQAVALQVSYEDKVFRQGTVTHDGILMPTLLHATPGLPTTYALVEGALPPGFSLNPQSGSIAGTATTPGVYSFKLLATNGSRTATTAVVTYIVEPAADLTVSYSNQTFMQGTAIPTGRFMPSLGNAVPALPTAFALAGGSLPPGMSLDPATGCISGTATKAGRYTFTIRATNGSRSAVTTQVVYLVESSDPLNVSYGDQLLRVGTEMSASPKSSLPTPGTTNEYGLGSGTLPPGLRIDPKTGRISGTPTTPGVFTFKVIIVNGSREGLSALVTYTVEDNRTLKLAYLNQTFNLGTTVAPGTSGFLPAVDFATPQLPSTFTVVSGSLPPNMTLNPSSGAISGTASAHGRFAFTVRISNGSRTAQTDVVYTVENTGALMVSHANRTLRENQPIPAPFPATVLNDTTGIPSTFTRSTGFPPGLSLEADGSISGTPTTPGVYTFTVTVQNGSRSHTSAPITYTVEDKDALTVAYANQTFNAGTVVAPSTYLPTLGEVTPNVPTAFAKVGGTLPPDMVLDPSTGSVHGTATTPGIYRFRISATNGTRTATTTVDVVYTVENSGALTVSHAHRTLREGQPIPTPFPANVLNDTTGIPSTFTKSTGFPPGLSLEADGSISGTPSTPGVYTFTVTVQNGSRSHTSAPVTYTVEDKDALTVAYANQTFNAGTVVSPNTYRPTLGEVTPNVPTTYAKASGTLPPDLVLDPNTGSIHGTATAPGIYRFRITATNGTRTATTATDVVYTVENSGALTVSHANRTLREGQPIPTPFPVSVLNDTTGIPSTFTKSTGFPPGLSLEADGSISGTPSTPGVYTFTVTVQNGTRSQTSAEITYTVEDKDTLTVAYANQTFPEGTVIAPNTYLPTLGEATPNLAASHAKTEGNLPPTLTVDPATGSIHGTANAAGVYKFKITTTHGTRTATTTADVVYTVEKNGALTLSYANQTLTQDQAIATPFPATVTNGTPDVTSTFTKAGNFPPGLILESNGSISGTPTTPGVYKFTVTVQNGTRSQTSAEITYTVEDKDTLTVAYANQTFPEGTVIAANTYLPALGEATPNLAASYAKTEGNLPPNLTVDAASGSIHGTAGAAGVYKFKITATQGTRTAKTTADVVYTVEKTGALTLSYVNKTLTLNDVVAPSTATFGPTLGNATPDLATTYRLETPDTLPPGMNLDRDTGFVYGQASAPGTYPFKVIATNGGRTITTSAISYVVQETKPTALNYKDNQAYFSHTAITPNEPAPTGGRPSNPGGYSLIGGSLPNGMQLNVDTGAITGTPTATGTFIITIQGANTGGSAQQTITFTVAATPTVTFTANPTSVPSGQSSSLTAILSDGLTGTLTGGPNGPLGTLASGGSVSTGILVAEGPVVYTLTVDNGKGGVLTRTATVTVVPVPSTKMEVIADPTSGGSGEIEANGSSLDGLKVVVSPQGGACSTVKLTLIQEELAAAGLTKPDSTIKQISKVYNLTTDVGYPFRYPISLSLPYDPNLLASAGLTPDDVVVPFYWDAAFGKWVVAGLKKVELFESAAGPNQGRRATFTTLLPGRYVLMAYAGLTPATLAPTFAVASDTLSLGNQGEYENPGGSSLGISAFQAWYQSMRKATNGNAGLKTLIPASAAIQAPLASRLAGGSLSSWNQLYSQSGYTLTANQTARALITGLKATGQPQLLLMKGERSGTTYTAVAMLATGYNNTNGTFNVVDPNFPSDDLTLTWDRVGAGSFKNYSREITYSPAPSAWAFEGQPSVHRLSDYEILLEGMKSTPRWKNPPFAQITADAVTDVNSGTGFRAVSDGGTVTVSHYAGASQTTFNASISGTVLDGDQTANYILASQNGGLRSPSALSGGAYTLNPFPLTNPYGTTVMLETAPNACDPTFTHSGFMSFTAKQDLLPDFFKNLCFEDNNTSSWTLSSRVQTNNSTYAGTDRTPTPGDWTVVVNAGADINSGTLNLPKVLSGSKALRVNTDRTGGDLNLGGAPASKVVQQVVIPDVAGADPKLEFYWAACMQDAGHDPWEQPYVRIVVEISAGANAGLKFIERHFVAGDSYTGWKSVSGTEWRIIPWQKISVNGLKAFKGQTVRLTVEAAGCVPTGHAGYAYIDALKCE